MILEPTLSSNCSPAKDRLNEWEHTDRITVEELPSLQAVSECGSTSNDEGNQKVKSYKIKRGTIKRKCKEHWKDIKRKKLANSGQPYISRNGKFRSGKQIGPACPTTCKLKCYAKFNDTIRENIHKEFWNLSDHCKHWKYINEYVEKTNKKRMTTESSRRQYTMKYYLPLPVDENSTSYERVRVCHRMFSNTLSISDPFVRTALKKLSSGTLTDNRGKHNNHRIAIDESMIESVCDHVSSFQLTKSRCKYCKQVYLGSKLSMSKMFALFKEWDKLKNYTNPAKTIRHYRDIINKYVKIAFLNANKNICNKCYKLND